MKAGKNNKSHDLLNPGTLTFDQALKRLRSEKQRRFVQAYLRTLCLAEAARDAGYSEKTARAAASRLFTNVNVREAILLGLEVQGRKIEAEAEDVIHEAEIVAFSSIADYIRWGSKPIIMKDEDTGEERVVGHAPYAELRNDIPEEKKRAVKKIKVTHGPYGSNVEISMYDKVRAIELLGKYFRLFEDKLKAEFDENDPLVKVLKSIDGKTRGLPPKSTESP